MTQGRPPLPCPPFPPGEIVAAFRDRLPAWLTHDPRFEPISSLLMSMPPLFSYANIFLEASCTRLTQPDLRLTMGLPLLGGRRERLDFTPPLAGLRATLSRDATAGQARCAAAFQRLARLPAAAGSDFPFRAYFCFEQPAARDGRFDIDLMLLGFKGGLQNSAGLLAGGRGRAVRGAAARTERILARGFRLMTGAATPGDRGTLRRIQEIAPGLDIPYIGYGARDRIPVWKLYPFAIPLELFRALDPATQRDFLSRHGDAYLRFLRGRREETITCLDFMAGRLERMGVELTFIRQGYELSPARRRAAFGQDAVTRFMDPAVHERLRPLVEAGSIRREVRPGVEEAEFALDHLKLSVDRSGRLAWKAYFRFCWLWPR